MGQRSRIDDLASTLRAQTQIPFIWAVTLTSLATVIIIVIVPGMVALALLLRLDVAGALVLTSATIASLMVAGIVSGLTLRRAELGAVQGWVDGSHREAEATWRALSRLPRATVLRAVTVVAPVFLAGIVPLAVRLTPDGDSTAAPLVLFFAWGGLMASAFVGVGESLLLRPLTSDVAAALEPAQLRDIRGPTVRARLLTGVLVVGFGTGTVTAGVSLHATTTASQLLSATAVALLISSYGVLVFISSYGVLVFDVGFVRPVLHPLDDLRAATEQVARGGDAGPAPVTSADELGDLITAYNQMRQGLAERQRLHAAFGSYVDPALAARLLEQGDDLFTGEEIDATVFFLDVRDFTSYAERAGPRATVARLNELFEIGVPILHDHGGHANKFTGDGFLAAFGVPGRIAHHADAAVEAAIEIHAAVCSHFGPQLRLGIGVHSGIVIAGTVGGGGKLEFTLIGDTVNTAARVEQLTKTIGDPILITAATAERLSRSPERLRDRGVHPLPGRQAAVRLHGIGGEEVRAPDPASHRR